MSFTGRLTKAHLEVYWRALNCSVTGRTVLSVGHLCLAVICAQHTFTVDTSFTQKEIDLKHKNMLQVEVI